MVILLKTKTMKKIISILFVASILLSCSDFLDVQPEGIPNKNNYFKNDYQAIKIVDELYARINQEGLFGREQFWEQGAANDVVWGRTRGYNSLATLNYTGNESPLRETWENWYHLQASSNFIITELLKKQKNTKLTAIETRSLGEAYFTRAEAHYMIAYRYGTKDQGVPFSAWETYKGEYDYSIPPQLASVIDNYKQIILDLDKAIEYLPRFEEYSSEDKGRAHKAAAVAYKAKTYAYWAMWDKSQWDNVIKMVNSLENDYGRGLADSFQEVFSSEFKDFWNKEYIWSIPSTGGDNGGGVEFPGVILENKGWGKYNGWGQNKATLDIYEEMIKDGEGNERLLASILEYNQEFYFFGEKRNYYSATDIESGFAIRKYMDAFKHKDATSKGYVNSNGNFPTARINFPIIRFADVLLLRAEAYIVTGKADKAKDDINRIRRRSNLTPLTSAPTMKELYHERRCELAFEYSDHLFDLKRWHLSGDATIKALAAKELNARPRVRNYVERSNPKSTFSTGYYKDHPTKNTYSDHMVVFPYPTNVIVNSNGLLKQNVGY